MPAWLQTRARAHTRAHTRTHMCTHGEVLLMENTALPCSQRPARKTLVSLRDEPLGVRTCERQDQKAVRGKETGSVWWVRNSSDGSSLPSPKKQIPEATHSDPTRKGRGAAEEPRSLRVPRRRRVRDHTLGRDKPSWAGGRPGVPPPHQESRPRRTLRPTEARGQSG